MDVANAKRALYTQPSGKVVRGRIFNSDDEKKRASKIVEQLKGLSIREAQQLLSKVSEAIIDAQTLS